MQRAIIHIGMPRTGSTTFQHVLAHRRPQIAAMGILYPDLTPSSARQHPHFNHQHLGETLDGRRPRREAGELFDRLSTEIETTKPEIVLLSYEDFVQQRQAGRISQTLRAFFERRGFAMEAMVAMKPQSELLNSIYSHRMQMLREKRQFAEFASIMMTSGRFAYDKLIEPWLAACSGRVSGVPIRDARSGAPLVRRMLAAAGVEERIGPLLAEDDATRVENRSPGPVAVEVARRLRHMRVQSRLGVVPREMMRVVEQLARDRGYDQIPFKGVGPELRALMSARYRSANDRVAMSLWGQPWSAVMAPEPDHPVSELAAGPITPAMEAVIDDILQEACRKFRVVPVRPLGARAMELLVDAGDWLGRSVRLANWRVM